MNVQEIYIGGWFQRTSLHLHEIYRFLKYAESNLSLDESKLKEYKSLVNPQEIELIMDELDYVSFRTVDDISVRIYEDGLTTLGTNVITSVLEKDFERMTSFYEDKLSKALSYIFSLGAPVPKELAHIKTIYPYFVILDNESEKNVNALLSEFNQTRYTTINKPSFSLVQGDKVYLFNNKTSELKKVRDFIEETIFLREFQGQLDRYLNLHRTIWEKIAEVKERGVIKGSEVKEYKTKAESYEKTINLIDTRISQMDSYIHTREKITRTHISDPEYFEILQYRYETLADSLKYVADLWVMTKNYVHSALGVFSSIQGKATESSIKGLTLITTVGVLASLGKLFFQDVTKFNIGGVGYFVGLLCAGYVLGYVMNKMGQNRTYKVKNIKTAQDI